MAEAEVKQAEAEVKQAEAEVKQTEAETVAGSDNCENVERNLRKVLSGTVIGDKMDKTIIVKVDRRMTHPLYGKVVKVTKKYYAHDANNEARVGDTVQLMETRPLSKLKRWRLISIERRAVTE